MAQDQRPERQSACTVVLMRAGDAIGAAEGPYPRSGDRRHRTAQQYSTMSECRMHEPYTNLSCVFV